MYTLRENNNILNRQVFIVYIYMQSKAYAVILNINIINNT